MSADPDETARASAEVMWSADAASNALGMVIEEVAAGRSRVSMKVRQDMVNGWGICHGGLIASLADSAFALACNSHGKVTVASGFQIDFLEPARLGDLLVASAREVARKGRSGVYDVTVSCDGVVVAQFRGRSRTQNQPILGHDEEEHDE